MTTVRLSVGTAAGDTYPVTLERADGDGWSPVATAALPHPLQEVAQHDGRPVAPADLPAVLSRGDAAELAAVGEALGSLLLSGDVGTELRRLRVPGAAPTRLLLNIVPSELSVLPWEAMQVSDSPVAPFADMRHTVARSAAHARVAGPPPSCWPALRALVVVAADERNVHARSELDGITAVLDRHVGFVDAEVLVLPTRRRLEEVWRRHRPHVVHVIGHRYDDEAAIAFAPGDHASWAWTPSGVMSTVQQWAPRLVVLNVCSTQRRRGPQGPWQVVDAFAVGGTAAVVAMHGEIASEAAARFGVELCRALLDGRRVDVAVARARQQLLDEPAWGSGEAWRPSLTLFDAPEAVLPQQFVVPRVKRANLRAHFPTVHAFVDRTEQRRDLWSAVTARADAAAVVAVVGARGVGKSALARWCLGSLALRGRAVARVSLKGRNRVDSLTLLGTIAGALATTEPHASAALAAFDRYAGAVDPDGWSERAQLAPDAGRYELPIPLGPENGAEHAVGLFKAALAELSGVNGGLPLVVAIDHVERIEPLYWEKHVRRHLVLPAAHGQVPLRLVLVGEAADCAVLVDERELDVRWIPLDAHPPEQFAPLLSQYAVARGYQDDGDSPPVNWGEVLGSLHRSRRRPWDAGMFRMVDDLAEQMGASSRWTW